MAGSLTISTLNNDTGVFATQNGMTGIAKAWVNFNGVTTTSIRGSYNISSVTRNSTGIYTINFTTAMPDVNYVTLGTTTNYTTSNWQAGTVGVNGSLASGALVYTTTSVQVVSSLGNNTSAFDAALINVAIFST
jgi:hypothetical protein